jgi:hypothetical protein
MKHLSLGSLTSATSGTAAELNTTPFMQGNTLLAEIFAPAGAFSGTAKLQSSDDNSSWSDISGSTFTTTAGGLLHVNIADAPKYIRLTCSSYSSGTVKAVLIGD